MRKKDVLTTGQVAQLCNVAPRTVTKWFDSGQLGGYRIPGSKDRRIPQSELIRFMKAHNIPTDELNKGKLRILIIDSHIEYARQLAAQLLSHGSFETRCVHNSFDAGLTALKFAPNIILFDLMSSEIDSGTICRYVRESEDLSECILIALAGGLGSKEVTALKHQGFDDAITEPENINTVLACIHNNCSILV